MNLLHKTTLVAVMSAGLFLALAQDASAQRGSFFGAARVQLASLAEVQAELKMSDEQKKLGEELNQKLSEDRRELFQTGGGGNFGEMREKLRQLSTDASAKLVAELDDVQQKRLTEIYVQINGTRALGDKDVTTALKITEEQNEKLTAVRDSNMQAFREAFQDFQSLSDEERREKFGQLRREGDEKLLAVLTEEQRTQFDAMKGKEIEVDLSPLRRRGR